MIKSQKKFIQFNFMKLIFQEKSKKLISTLNIYQYKNINERGDLYKTENFLYQI